jgi:hypothetical protein
MTPFTYNTLLEIILFGLIITGVCLFTSGSLILVTPQYSEWLWRGSLTEQVQEAEVYIDTPNPSVASRLLRDRAYTTDGSQSSYRIYEEV